MKIKSISRKYCGEDNITLTTEPILTGQIYEKFRQMLETDEQMSHYQPTFNTDGMLTIKPANFPPNFREHLERLLSSAESYLKHTEEMRQEQSDRARSAKEHVIQAAARVLGVPIE